MNPPFKIGDKVIGQIYDIKFRSENDWFVKVEWDDSDVPLIRNQKATIIDIKLLTDSLMHPHYFNHRWFKLDEEVLFHNQLEALSDLPNEDLIETKVSERSEET